MFWEGYRIRMLFFMIRDAKFKVDKNRCTDLLEVTVLLIIV